MNTESAIGRHAHILASVSLGAALLLTAPLVAHASFDTDADLVSDEIDVHPCDPLAAATAFAPARGDHGMLLFEDQFPAQGDFDFNDVALTYNYVFRLDRDGNVASLRATFNTLAVGGDYHNGFGLRIPMRAREVRRATRTIGGISTDIQPSALDNDATFFIVNDLRDLFTNPQGLINADPALPRQQGQVVQLEIVFDQARPFPVQEAPYDVFIHRTDNPSIEVHRPGFRGTARMDTTLFNTQDDTSDGVRNFVDTRGIPFGLHFPTLVDYPSEGVGIDVLYPNIVRFGQSGGQAFQNFYVSSVNLSAAYRGPNNQPAFPPNFINGPDLAQDTSCVPAWGLAVQWGTRRSIFTYGGAMAPNGDAILTGYTRGQFPNSSNAGGLDGFVARHDALTGAEVWITQLGTAGDDTGRDVTMDGAGNIYVVGDRSSQASGSWYGGSLAGVTDAFVSKINPNGRVLWTRTIDSAGNDSGYGVAVDANGNVYVAGSASAQITGAQDPGGFPSSFLAKFNNNGTRRWVHQYRTDNAHPSNYSYNADIAIDAASGALYVVGTERRFNRDASAASNPFVAKHRRSDGALLWVNHLGDYGYWNNSLDGRFGYAFGVDVDPFDGSAYVTGSFATGSNTTTWGSWSKAAHDDSPDAFFARVNPRGRTIWSRSLASDGHGQEYAEAVMASGIAGVVYFTGRTSGTLPGQTNLGGTDYYLAAFGHDGAERWVVQGGTPQMDMGHLAAATACSQSGGTVFTLGNADVAAGSSVLWQTAMYRHDITTGALQGVTVAERIDWSTSGWTACSNSCGVGTRSRNVACTQPDGTVVSALQCRHAAPAATGACYGTSGCAAQWEAGAWSACSQTCGVGERTRVVECMANGVLQSPSVCGDEAPASTEACGGYSACTYAWDAQAWGACDVPAPCTMGTQSRTSFCQRSDGSPAPDAMCSGPRPASQRSCSDSSCPAIASSCAALRAQGVSTSGRYDVDPDGAGPGTTVNVYCDMTSFGGGWTNIDFAGNRVWLDAQHSIVCTNGLMRDESSISCNRPRFDGQESLPLYQFRCDGGDRSVDYVLEHVAPLLGHQSTMSMGFTSLQQGPSMGGGASSAGNEYCFAHGVIARADHVACAPYRVQGSNQQCIPGYFTLSL